MDGMLELARAGVEAPARLEAGVRVHAPEGARGAKVIDKS